MIRKTRKLRKRRVYSWTRGHSSTEEHLETVEFVTYWLLFIPIYHTEYVLISNI